MTRIHLHLSQDERDALEQTRDHHPKAYMREKAAALLQVAAGHPACQVAASGLLRHRTPNTLYHWVARYRRTGIPGLVVQPGRGRRPAFFPPDQGAGTGSAAPPAAP